MAYGGVDTYTKLLIHGDGTDTATFVPDSSNVNHQTANVDKAVLMLHFDGADEAVTTKDASTNKTVTFVGTAQLDTAQSKFGGSSLLLDGNSDYVTLADSDDFTLGTGDFTIETWIRLSAVDARVGIGGQCNSAGAESASSFWWEVQADNTVKGWVHSGGSSYSATSTTTLLVNTWYHLAFVRYGNTITLYINGTADGTGDVTGITVNNSDQVLAIGRFGAYDGFYFPGHIDDFRIIKGKALYTANFTAPTVSPSPKLVTCVGNAQIDTAQKKFGTGSILFDGTGDYLSLADSDDWDVGYTFTIDCWIRLSNVAGAQHIVSHRESPVNLWWVGYNGITKILEVYSYIYAGDVTPFDISCAFDPTVNTWYHIAWVRIDNGNTSASWRIYVDGVSQTLTKIGGEWNGATPEVANYLAIGRNGDVDDTYFFGWIDELRISKGIARWTSNFTPPALAYGQTMARSIITT